MGRPLLVEIGTEELPSSFVDAALAALPELTREALARLRLRHGAVRALGTPRRLAVLVDDVAEAQADLDEEVVGPPETAAFKDGAPTKAAEAFAAKIGAPLADLQVVDRPAVGKQKAGRYVVGRRREQGRPAAELLGPALVELFGKIPFRKSMRWADLDVAFGRPVQWIVALFDADVVPLAWAGVTSGRASRGHRFLAPASFDLPRAADYVEALRARHVLVDRAERERTMMDRVAAEAKAAGGAHDPAPELVSENASLVEEPFIVRGSFDPAFLELPAAVIRSVARGHQKYFCVEKPDGSLLPTYLAVANTALAPEKVRLGNDRVMRPRLADARFFFEKDLSVPLEDRVAKLEGVVFHNRLGSVRDKVRRLERLAGALAEPLGLDATQAAHAVRAAHLAKFDLVTLMVGEFPELQGEMGRTYALRAGEPLAVADAVRDHYAPVSADAPTASDPVAATVALADRLDSLVGCFAIGLSPTGAADPFALRRACLAVLRTLLEQGATRPHFAEAQLRGLFELAYDGFEGTKLDLGKADAVTKLLDFARERLRNLVAQSTSTLVADAVLGGEREPSPHRVVVRARVLGAALTKDVPWLEKARTVAKRLSGISKEQAPKLHAKGSFAKADDAAIVELVEKLDALTTNLTSDTQVERALAGTEELATHLDAIFANTLVNDPADDATPRRLEVLSFGAQCMLRVADFSRLGAAP